MPKYKHLTLSERITIETMLDHKAKLNQISAQLEKQTISISKEIRAHSVYERVGGIHIEYNACALYSQCSKSHLCSRCVAWRKYSLCRSCSMCNSFCKDFQKMTCYKLSKPPYVCNGCGNRLHCRFEKSFYRAQEAHNQYRKTLSESRSGISLSEGELAYLDELITPLIKQSQSPHHICVTNKDSIMISERTIYRLINSRAISATNLDLPRKVRFRPRKKTVTVKVDKKCRINRTYEDFKAYLKEHPDVPITQLDSVESFKGGNVLLTIHFVKCEMMLAFVREHNDSKSVIKVFNDLYEALGSDKFTDIFQVCLADNGSEFSNPLALEFDSDGVERTHIFYCDPRAPYQKGSAERNHEFIRMFFPKGKQRPFPEQEKVTLMMDHINSYCRPSLGNKCPYDVFSFFYGEKALKALGCHVISPQNVTLNRSILRKEAPNHEV